MIYRRSHRFKKAFRVLPANVQKKAFKYLAEDPRHPSLGIKKIKGAEGIWEGRIDRSYRITFHFEADEGSGDTVCVFRNVDNHDACLKNP